jgi:hypothetical protein
MVVVVLLAITIINWRNPKRRSDGKYTIGERLIIGCRVIISAWFTAVAMMLSVRALKLYDNLSILAMIPVSKISFWKNRKEHSVWLTGY